MAMRAVSRASTVWFVGAMGLLDDAIREHLELKRLRGADLSDVARAEQDALGPAPHRGAPQPGEHPDDHADAQLNIDDSYSPEPELIADANSSSHGHIGQETVEINMEAEFEKGIDLGQ